MARFTSPIGIRTGDSANGTWIIEGGTLSEDPDDQPDFSSDPLFSGHYTAIDGVCHFAIDVDMDNITDFGAGQYYLKLPFAAHHNVLLSNGCLHDESGGDQYAVLGHVEAGSDVMTLLSIASNGRHVPFEDGTPVVLNLLDNFHIAGSYEIDH